MYQLFLCKFKGDQFLKISRLEKVMMQVNAYKPENWTEFEKHLRKNDPPQYNEYLAEIYNDSLFDQAKNINLLSIEEYKNKDLEDELNENLSDFHFKKITFSESLLDINFPDNVFEVSSLYCNGKSTKGTIDFNKYKSLKELHVLSYNTGIKFKNVSNSVKQITLWYFNPKTKSLKAITDFFPNVEEVTIHHTNIETLDGIDDFTNLKNLHIDYGKNLRFIKSIDFCQKLKKVTLNNCRKIEDFDKVDNRSDRNIINAQVPG